MKMNVAHASLPKTGEKANGDQPFVRRDEDGRNLIAVFDGLGHGYEAQLAALAGVRFLGETRLDAPFEELMQGLHQSLRGTRGAAITVCVNSGAELTACSVGNVEMRAMGADIPLIPSAGILGVRVQRFRVCRTILESPCRLLIFSDGISNPTSAAGCEKLSPQVACDGLLQRHRRTYDDATVLIADLE